MKRVFLLLFLLSFPALAQVEVASPDGKNVIRLEVDDTGIPLYRVYREGRMVIEPSQLGFRFRGKEPMVNDFELVRHQSRTVDETWETVWGERELVRNHFLETSVWLREETGLKRSLRVDLRAYNDGLAFRVTIPEQKGFEGEFELTSEETRFALGGDYTAWWIPDNWDTYEMLYTQSPASKIGLIEGVGTEHTHSAERTDGLHGCNTPVTMQAASDLFLAIHEANLTDYAGMTLVHDPERPGALMCNLVPWPDGIKVRGQAPLVTPWRTIQLASTPGQLVDSTMILNLNPPNQLAKLDYVRPMKLVGIWWSMHLGITTWGKDGGRHGATTAEVKRHIDFAAEHGFDGVLVEGWNTGWESWYQDNNFDFTTPYDDFDLAGLAAYARSQGVELVGHLETGGQIESFEKRLEESLAQYQRLGITSVKTGYAGKIRPPGTYHHGQKMVRHYRKVVETAARYGITVNAHEPIKDTGIRRTYPNMMTREGVRGMEWNAWSQGNPPEHTVNLAFTRMLAGPLDYTPGIFDLRYEKYADQYRFWNPIDGLETKGKMHSTLARQLALFVVLYSPIQMASDLIENYPGQKAFQFIKEVPVDWSESRTVAGQLGDYVVIARRRHKDWFVGALTDEKARTLELPLDFLEPGQTYQATLYEDGAGAHYQDNPSPYKVVTKELRREDKLTLKLAPGGGQAIVLRAQ